MARASFYGGGWVYSKIEIINRPTALINIYGRVTRVRGGILILMKNKRDLIIISVIIDAL